MSADCIKEDAAYLTQQKQLFFSHPVKIRISDLRLTINQFSDLLRKRLTYLNFFLKYVLKKFRKGHIFRMWHRKLLKTELSNAG